MRLFGSTETSNTKPFIEEHPHDVHIFAFIVSYKNADFHKYLQG